MDESERLRTEVQDERARRRWAERELAAESDKRALWRKRAEDRADRIKLLEERIARLTQSRSLRDRMSHLLGRRTSPQAAEVGSSGRVEPRLPMAPEAPSAAAASDVARDRRVPAFPTVRVAALGNLPPFLGEFETVDLSVDTNVLYDSDLVFLDAASVASADETALAPVRQWLELPARQPLVLWSDATAPPPAGITEWVGVADFQVSAQLLHDRRFPEYADEQPVAHTVDGRPLSHYAAMLLLASGVPVFASAEHANRSTQTDDRFAVVARRIAWRNASPAALARALLDVVGIDVADQSNQIGALLVSNKPALVVGAVAQLRQQRNVDVLPMIGLHGEHGRFAEAREQIEEMLGDAPHRVVSIGSEVPLGKALNIVADSCDSPLLAKIDDDDWYGDHYLEEALYAVQRSGADVVGKACYHVEFEESRDVYLVAGAEDEFTNHLIGSSLVFSRGLWQAVPLPHRPSRVDSVFLRGIRAADRTIYSTSRFDFAVRRRASGHTWDVDPAHFAARGIRVGDSLESVSIGVPDSLLGWQEPPKRA